MPNHKFQLFCSCVVCKTQMSIQNLGRHYTKHFAQPKEPKNKCLNCNKPTNSKFCSHSCAATYTNARKDYTKIKSGPAKFVGPKLPKHKYDRSSRTNKNEIVKFSKISWCTVCGKCHTKSGKSCSDKCKSILISRSVIRRIENGWNPNENRVRSTPVVFRKIVQCLVD